MSAIFNFIGCTLAFTAGLFTGAFFVIQSMTCLFFGVPFTLKLRRASGFSGKPPIIRYICAPVFLMGLFALASWSMLTWFPGVILWYWLGAGLTVLLGLPRCFANQRNVAEYLEANQAALRPDVADRFNAHPSAPKN